MPKLELENLGGFITVKGVNGCLGYLIDFKDKGVFDAEYGKVDVTPEQAEEHNRLLDEAILDGLVENCQKGEGGSLYFNPTSGVRTFLGTQVSETVKVTGRRITFARKGRTFRGTLRKDSDLFSFKRIA